MQTIHIDKWTPDLAYIVGLLVTDGCLSSDGRHIIFTSQDLELIDNFRQILGITNSIGKTINRTSEAYRVQVGSTKLYHWLESIGLTPHKSLTIAEIAVPEQFFLDFLRGHLDGDGSITTYLDSYNAELNSKYVYRRLSVRFISGSATHIDWLQNNIIALTGIKGKIHKTRPSHIGNSLSVLKFGKKESLKLLERIYYTNQLRCLTRKRQIYQKFIMENES